MRKPTTINARKAGSLYQYCIQRALHLDTCHRIIRTADGLAGLLGDVRTIARYAAKISRDAEAELGFAPDESEADARNYLESI